MKAKDGVLDFLNKILTAPPQYLLQGAMCSTGCTITCVITSTSDAMDEIHHTEELAI